jgi:hypothetical protein
VFTVFPGRLEQLADQYELARGSLAVAIVGARCLSVKQDLLRKVSVGYTSFKDIYQSQQQLKEALVSEVLNSIISGSPNPVETRGHAARNGYQDIADFLRQGSQSKRL